MSMIRRSATTRGAAAAAAAARELQTRSMLQSSRAMVEEIRLEEMRLRR